MKRILLTILLIILLPSFNAFGQKTSNANHREGVTLKCVKPQYLKAGDRIALISPAYYAPMEKIEKAAEVLRRWGFVPVLGPNVGKQYAGKYAGSTQERVDDLLWALNDTSIKAIICNRGGYGTVHYIDIIPLSVWASHPKWLMGYSDISTLHGLLTRAGVMSIHGTMSTSLCKGGFDETSLLARDLLMGKVPLYKLPTHPQNIEGRRRQHLHHCAKHRFASRRNSRTRHHSFHRRDRGTHAKRRPPAQRPNAQRTHGSLQRSYFG